MKICPTCKQTYADDSLNFCLSDGAILTRINADDDLPQTVFMGQPNPTNRNFGNQTNQDENVRQPAGGQYTAPPKKSRAWMWVVGVVGGVILLGILGFIGLIAIALNFGETNNANSNIVSNQSSNRNLANRDSTAVMSDNFATWRRGVSDIGIADYKDGEYIISSNKDNFYYVAMTGNSNFKTDNATTSVKVRNMTGAPTRYGFGLVVKANSEKSLRYAFLIDTVRQSYRVVIHSNQKETPVIDWKVLPAINTGTQTNELQVRDENGKMIFSINNKPAVTINDATNTSGVAGIYSSSIVPVAFSDLQIGK